MNLMFQKMISLFKKSAFVVQEMLESVTIKGYKPNLKNKKVNATTINAMMPGVGCIPL
jgi:hypothetical protein